MSERHHVCEPCTVHDVCHVCETERPYRPSDYERDVHARRAAAGLPIASATSWTELARRDRERRARLAAELAAEDERDERRARLAALARDLDRLDDPDRPCACGRRHTAAEHSYDPDRDDAPDPDDAP